MKKMLEIPSKIESLKEVEKLVDEISKELKLENTLYGNVLIALIEAVNNSIIHGNKGKEEKKVTVDINKKEDLLNITIKDEGKGFDYENIPDPTAPENLENINGRGIFLMKSLSDNIEFHDNGSTVEIQFNL
jgi:serine/threonine-protein kinase RsbW